jgi:hypothetical protein
VKKTLTTGAALAALLSVPGYAQQSTTLDRVMREIEALNARVTKLEQENDQLEAQNAQLLEKNDRLEATSEYLRTNASATRKQLAEESPKVAEAERIAKAAEWASKITWKGDFRYRHENIDPEEAATDQDRQRIRARFGLVAKINDSLSATIQLATGGGTNDPRSTNQTLGSGWDRKQVALDLAYADWKFADGFNLQLGKMPLPFVRAPGYMWDGDLTPEGGAVKFASGPFFANAFGYWLSERSTATDTSLLGAQFGLTSTLGSTKLTAAAAYFDVGPVQGHVTATPTGCATAFNPAFFGGAQGNTTVTVAGCPRLANDFNNVELLGTAEFKLGSLPLVVFADYLQNQEADEFDTAYAAGITLGRASAAKSWEFGYVYQVVEKDSQFGQFIDSDFGGGITDTEGGVIRAGFVPFAGFTLNGAYFVNKRFVDVGTERDYARWQLDLNYRY